MSAELTAALDRALGQRLGELGITRLADTTGLDRLGIQTHSCVRPGTTDSIWVYSGKGLTPAASRVSAVMECVERTSALWSDASVKVCARAALGAWPVLGPEVFTEASTPATDAPEAWVLAHRLGGGRVWVPAELVFLDRPARPDIRWRFVAQTSNGLGAGTTFEAALGHALEELIERDVVSCAELRASHGGAAALASVARASGLELDAVLGRYRDDVDAAITIDPTTVPEPAAGVLRRFAAIGLAVTLKYLPNDLGVPVVGAAAVEELAFDNVLAAAGFAASLDTADAVLRALLELAQSRATDRQGAREDCGHEEKGRHRAPPRAHWLAEPGRPVPFASLPWGAKGAGPRTARYRRALAAVGLDQVAYHAFHAPAGLHVVRALVPELETWHATAGDSRLGRRMARELAAYP